MNEFLLLKLLHVIGFAYWLGADLGVFYSSYFVADEKRSADVRIATAKILFALDQAPRICMTMMLPLGVHLTWRMGLFSFDPWVMGLIWILCFGWLAMVVTLHVAKPSDSKAILTSFDFAFRFALAVALVALGAAAQFAGLLTMPHWVALKLLIYGILVGCGLLVRVRLKPFAPAFAKLARGEADAADSAAIARSLGATRPYVITIWAGLIVSTALGLHLF